ncbi:MAG: 3-hydroxyacyl-CoA dehydrogenase NAD-binding domain-containing protein [Pseudomonadota bacterium]
MKSKLTYKNWRLETDADEVLWVYFDKEGASANTLDMDTLEEFNAIIDYLTNDRDHRGVIIASAKKNGFIAGADISQFEKFKDIDEATSVLQRGDEILGKLEALKIPVVAMIDGFCLGGGLELALACHYRVVEDGLKTRLGLPEVKLGIHPGWGGSVRLPRLIGAPNAMNLILSGSTISGKAAAKLGIADVAVPKRHLVKAAKWYALQKPRRHEPTLLQSLSNTKPVRMLLAAYLRKTLRSKAPQQFYPAPYHVVDNWEQLGVEGNAPFEREARDAGKLFFSDTSENLVRVFFLQERLKGFGKGNEFKPKHVHVIGAGTMGGDIAAWCAYKGFTVTLQDREPKFIAPAIKRAYQLFKEKLKEDYLVQNTMDRLIPDTQGFGVAKADVIIEAIFEDLKTKQDLFKQLETQAKPNAILATNTSSIPLDEINKVLQNPGRLVGIHFFNPVAKMLLVEVVKGERTDAKVLKNAFSFVGQLERLPLPVKSSPGFLVNRVLMPYLLEAMNMLDEGIPAAAIDKSMTDFGMPMGPITLADTVGLDICLSVAQHLSQYFPNVTISKRLTDMVEQKKLGRKTGQGFYKWVNGKPVKPRADYDKPLTDLSDRLVLCMLNESFACLRENVVADGDLLDAGMIFGTGFAPFRGGPIHYAKQHGIHELFEQYVKLQEKAGKTEKLTEWNGTTS